MKKLTVRTGFGLYYDRGELFSYLSAGAGGGFSGPFGVTLSPPFVSEVTAGTGSTFANPFPAAGAVIPGSPAQFLAQLPNLKQTAADTNPPGNLYGPFIFSGYDINNKLPYTENWTFDLRKYQLTNSFLVTAGYVGNHGQHLVIPVTFNEPSIDRDASESGERPDFVVRVQLPERERTDAAGDAGGRQHRRSRSLYRLQPQFGAL